VVSEAIALPFTFPCLYYGDRLSVGIAASRAAGIPLHVSCLYLTAKFFYFDSRSALRKSTSALSSASGLNPEAF
jgi:hypothetical protein